jgi:hypothetical protein
MVMVRDLIQETLEASVMTRKEFINKTIELLKNEPDNWKFDEYIAYYTTDKYVIDVWYVCGAIDVKITLSLIDPKYPQYKSLRKKLISAGGLSVWGWIFSAFTWRGQIINLIDSINTINTFKIIKELDF